MSIRDKALADIASVIDPDKLGVAVTIDGTAAVCIRGDLSAEEKVAEGLDGLNDETLVLHLEAADLLAVPVPGQVIDLDGEDWTVVRPVLTGTLLKLILHRYTS